MAEIYLDNKSQIWYARWMDHACRIVKRRIGTKIALIDWSDNDIRQLAARIAQTYINRHNSLLKKKKHTDDLVIYDMANRSAFPRAVVAQRIEAICERIARIEGIDTRTNRPGLHVFIDRLEGVPGSRKKTISAREVRRILEDESRVSVSIEIVDKICNEFDLFLIDFIQDSLDWASKRGNWKDRPGKEDSWPFGYVTEKQPGESDYIL